jgi:hypothetical protein
MTYMNIRPSFTSCTLLLYTVLAVCRVGLWVSTDTVIKGLSVEVTTRRKRTKEHSSLKWPLQASKGLFGGMGGTISHAPPPSGPS